MLFQGLIEGLENVEKVITSYTVLVFPFYRLIYDQQIFCPIFFLISKLTAFRRRAGNVSKPIHCFEDNVDFIGRDINSCSETITKSPEDCQFLCQDDPNCNFFVWIKSTHRKKNQCCFKQKKKRKLKRHGMISGPKYCPGTYESMF